MILLGLAGHAGSGKDTVASYLVERYGFVSFSFSDALYREVAEAFSLPDDSLLRDRETKEVPSEHLALVNCLEDEFIGVAVQHISHASHHLHDMPLSPRRVLQLWGTEYRRAQNPAYWVEQADQFIYQMTHFGPYAELRPANFVNTSVRFPNEREWIRRYAPFGSVWHLHRDTIAPVNPHTSETPLPVLPGEREIWNNYTIEYLHMGIDQFMSSNIPSIRIEPPEPMVAPDEKV